MIKRGTKVKVCNVKSGKFCATAGYHTIDDKFTQYQRISVDSRVASVADSISHDGDARAVRVLLLGAEFVYY